MLRSTMRTILNHRFAVGVSAVALLGGGAALAAPGGPFVPDDGDMPLEVAPPDETPPIPNVVPTQDLGGNTGQLEAQDDSSEEVSDQDVEGTEASEESERVTEGDAPEEEGNAWALGSDDPRLEDFCVARMAEAEAVDAEVDAESVGVPPFCDVEGGPVAPNAHGQDTAEEARNRVRPDGSGPPPWANSKRPDGVPPGPPADVRRGEDEDSDTTDEGSESDTPIEPAGAPEVESDGPPPHANARANRGD